MSSLNSNPSAANAAEAAGPSRRLVVFTRYPEPGKAKTRLAGVLGAHGAAELQREMTRHILGAAGRFAAARGVRLEVRFDSPSRLLMRETFGGACDYVPQGDGDLGQRMHRAFEQNLRGGASVVVIGSDCPDVTAEILGGAFEALSDHDAVFGPAADGGYYLVGLKRAAGALFEGIEWGAAAVLARSLEKARGLGLSVALLGRLGDVDRPKDLAVWRRHAAKSARRELSVIVPALDDEGTIAAALVAPLAAGAQVIVADGGSKDRTREIAELIGAEVITTPAGRAGQMNAGAVAAEHDTLLFLHADSRLPGGFADEVERVLREPGVAVGAFTFRPDRAVKGLPAVERLINLRSRHLQMPYGDQGIFVRADIFREIGGFPEIPVMEDFEFVRRLRRKGRAVISPLPVVTSARRWAEAGVLRITIINQLMIAGYLLGVSSARLARWYDRKRKVD